MAIERSHGLGVLDWLDDTFVTRLLRFLGPYAVVLGVLTFMLDLEDVKDDRDARAWRLLAIEMSGNSGKIEALEYLNKHNPLSIPNPRRFGVPLGPEAREADQDPPEQWVVIQNYGPWKSRTILEGVDLARPKKSGVEEGAILKHADDRWAAPGTYLIGVDLTDANLYFANFSGAVLERANFNRAYMPEANLKGSYLAYATLWRANLSRAELSGSWSRQADFGSADLISADLREGFFELVNFSYAYLEDAKLNGADFKDADFNYANLKRADLRDAYLEGATFKNADLSGADLTGAVQLRQEQLNEACAENAKLPEDLTLPPACERDEDGNRQYDDEGNIKRVSS